MYHTKLVTLWKSMRPEKSLENLPPTLTALEQHIKEELNGNLYNYGVHFQKQQVHALN